MLLNLRPHTRYVAYYGAEKRRHSIPGSGDYLSGFGFQTAMVLMLLLSLSPIRRCHFEFFYTGAITTATTRSRLLLLARLC
jgi:hypothetical protein